MACNTHTSTYFSTKNNFSESRAVEMERNTSACAWGAEREITLQLSHVTTQWGLSGGWVHLPSEIWLQICTTIKPLAPHPNPHVKKLPESGPEWLHHTHQHLLLIVKNSLKTFHLKLYIICQLYLLLQSYKLQSSWVICMGEVCTGWITQPTLCNCCLQTSKKSLK